MRVAVSKSVAALVGLLTVVACQSTRSGSITSPGAPTGWSASSTQTKPLRYPNDPMRQAVAEGRFVATYTVDHGALTIGPPPAGPPAMTERAAINRFHLFGIPDIRRGFTAYGSVTVVPAERPLVRVTDKPAWVITFLSWPIPCPPGPYSNGRLVPLSLELAIVPTDGSRAVVFHSAGRTMCGQLNAVRVAAIP